ncbi:MAG: bifunctional folylpolyglutamate synthase/dihydrofolate synthase [Candidatus Wallbacteria bacterium]|nr:bifunctional folylpolyglutamate synthase/dihydrofolate synthase [Candidatus Wallbacteria bacterium]
MKILFQKPLSGPSKHSSSESSAVYRFTYQEALRELDNIINTGVKYELAKIKRLSEILGNPQKKYRIVHITGTKGKGSTGAILSGVLTGKIKTGFFSSPHLVSFCERIRINNQQISENKFAENFSEIWPAILQVETELGAKPSFFEIFTALAYYIFRKEHVELAIVEVGLGGRLDATNVADGDICVLTRIHYDHIRILGNTLAQIAAEKAGIIKENSLVVNVNRGAETLPVIRKKVTESPGASLFYAPSHYRIAVQKSDLSGLHLDVFKGNKLLYRNLFFPLPGAHQLENLKAALLTLELLSKIGFPVNVSTRDFSLISWPGRLQVYSHNPLVILDGAHNQISGKKLSEFLEQEFCGRKILFLLGILEDKEYGKFIRILAPRMKKVVLTEVESPRTLKLKSLFAELTKYLPENRICVSRKNENALKKALKIARRENLPLIITGSLYLLGSCLKALDKIRVNEKN